MGITGATGMAGTAEATVGVFSVGTFGALIVARGSGRTGKTCAFAMIGILPKPGATEGVAKPVAGRYGHRDHWIFSV